METITDDFIVYLARNLLTIIVYTDLCLHNLCTNSRLLQSLYDSRQIEHRKPNSTIFRIKLPVDIHLKCYHHKIVIGMINGTQQSLNIPYHKLKHILYLANFLDAQCIIDNIIETNVFQKLPRAAYLYMSFVDVYGIFSDQTTNLWFKINEACQNKLGCGLPQKLLLHPRDFRHYVINKQRFRLTYIKNRCMFCKVQTIQDHPFDIIRESNTYRMPCCGILIHAECLQEFYNINIFCKACDSFINSEGQYDRDIPIYGISDNIRYDLRKLTNTQEEYIPPLPPKIKKETIRHINKKLCRQMEEVHPMFIMNS